MSEKKPAWLPNEQTAANNTGAIIRAEVMDEPAPAEIWAVKNKQPGKRYVFARKDDDVEMTLLASRGYIPATGPEKIMGNPFEASKDNPGGTKVRGSRILMMCDERDYLARQKAQAARHVSAKQSAESDARRMMAEHKGAFVKADAG